MILDKIEQDMSALNLEDLKESLINHICSDNKAFFKSQQKDEPEINFDEKKNIATTILDRSHTNFLSRFGMSIKKEHLQFFELNNHTCSNEEEKKMVEEQIKHLSHNLDHEKTLVKNRRYAAMVKLIKEKNYFSESEMKQRDPLLYEQLIGQFLTEAEKRARRRPDAKISTLVDVLFEGMDHERDRTTENEQRKIEEQDDDDDSQSVKSVKIDDDEEEEESDHEQWGNFENNQTSAPSTSRKRKAQVVTAGERDVMRDEFLGQMYNNFLSGKDSEFFNYSEVDDNEAYDETLENDQDCEDKYFDEEESQDAASVEKMENSEASDEDELDIYMRHIEDNLKRQKQEAFQEEFDED